MIENKEEKYSDDAYVNNQLVDQTLYYRPVIPWQLKCNKGIEGLSLEEKS